MDKKFNNIIDKIAELESQKRVIDTQLKDLREALKEDALNAGLMELDTGYTTMQIIPRSKIKIIDEAQLMAYLKDEGIIFEFVKLDISNKKLADVTKYNIISESQKADIMGYIAEEFEMALKITPKEAV